MGGLGGRWFAMVLAATGCLLMSPCHGKGKLEIMFLSYMSTCKDNTFFGGLFEQPCDVFFDICIDKPGPVNFHDCFYEYKQTRPYDNTDHVSFGSDIGGVSNPRVVEFDGFQDKRVMLAVRVMDDEFFMGDEHLATMSTTFTLSPAARQSLANWTSSYVSTLNRYSYRMNFKYRAYCEPNYYNSACDKYCRARDDSFGHYSCDPVTGQKQCHPGWEGPSCDVDINECLQGPCFNGAPCTNLDGSYECRCPDGVIGKNCDLIDNMCYSSPCQNGGTCNGSKWNYTCSCAPEWRGRNCDTQVDKCQSSPCKNGGTCFNTVGHYTCDCAPGWTGRDCQSEVNACHSVPCQHGGTCTKKPRGQFECSCPEEYEGSSCEVPKNPCDSSPCLNSGTCRRLSHERYTCTCTPVWEGHRCEHPTNFCHLSPCGNGGTCNPTNGSYLCVCAVGWKGENCTVEVNPCDARPCQNGGQCSKTSGRWYECSCPVDYEGHDCQIEKDPCRSNPCYHGTCKKLDHSLFQCMCTKGWSGPHCYKRVQSEVSSQQKKKQDVELLPIILGILLPLILVVLIVIAVCLCRRRRRKLTRAGSGVTVLGSPVHVVEAPPGDYGVPNPLYFQTDNFHNVLRDRPGTTALPAPVSPPPYTPSAAGVGAQAAAAYPVKSAGRSGVENRGEEGRAVGGGGRAVGGGGRAEADFLKVAVIWKKDEVENGPSSGEGAQAERPDNDYANPADLQSHSEADRRDDADEPADPTLYHGLDDETDEDEYGVSQEDLDQLRQEVLQRTRVDGGE
ncbi:uncharacterized protein LOC143299430 [Babylonia areolata]|uniref:uncharacterized protein LOC143299430 n=1 Tax=Babylonia areolata TaxID=304850 RepID=UPI003FD013B6